MLDIVVLLSAAFLAGMLNSIAGGGSFLTFPALVFVGVPPIPANATSAIAVFPGYLSGTIGFLDEIKKFDRKELYLLTLLSIIGGVAGGLLLLYTPSTVFSAIVPWLLLFATLLFAFDKKISRWVASRQNAKNGAGKGAEITATLVVTTYGGYFNGGLGIILLALFSALGFKDLNLMNGLKNGLSFILSTASVVTFTIAGIVYWKEAVIMMIATVIGGYIGALVAKKLPKPVMRAIIITVGSVMTGLFLAKNMGWY